MKKCLVSFAAIIFIAANFLVLSEGNSGNLFSNVSVSMLASAFAKDGENDPPKKVGNSPVNCFRLNEKIDQEYCGDGNYCDGEGSSCDGLKKCEDICFKH